MLITSAAMLSVLGVHKTFKTPIQFQPWCKTSCDLSLLQSESSPWRKGCYDFCRMRKQVSSALKKIKSAHALRDTADQPASRLFRWVGGEKWRESHQHPPRELARRLTADNHWFANASSVTFLFNVLFTL